MQSFVFICFFPLRDAARGTLTAEANASNLTGDDDNVRDFVLHDTTRFSITTLKNALANCHNFVITLFVSTASLVTPKLAYYALAYFNTLNGSKAITWLNTLDPVNTHQVIDFVIYAFERFLTDLAQAVEFHPNWEAIKAEEFGGIETEHFVTAFLNIEEAHEELRSAIRKRQVRAKELVQGKLESSWCIGIGTTVQI